MDNVVIVFYNKSIITKMNMPLTPPPFQDRKGQIQMGSGNDHGIATTCTVNH